MPELPYLPAMPWRIARDCPTTRLQKPGSASLLERTRPRPSPFKSLRSWQTVLEDGRLNRSRFATSQRSPTARCKPPGERQAKDLPHTPYSPSTTSHHLRGQRVDTPNRESRLASGDGRSVERSITDLLHRREILGQCPSKPALPVGHGLQYGSSAAIPPEPIPERDSTAQ
jgi:hypothetical protein